MTKGKFWEWFKAVGIRALKTMLETFASFLVVGWAIEDIQWWHALSVTLVAGVATFIVNAANTLPETQNDGNVIIIPDEETKGAYGKVELDIPVEKILEKEKITLTVLKK